VPVRQSSLILYHIICDLSIHFVRLCNDD